MSARTNDPVKIARWEARMDAGFWARVDKSGECWVWTGAKDRKGYGVAIRRDQRFAHRVSWVMANGPIPTGLMVLHSCDNPPCVNPAHLRLGTARDNSRDMDARGRRTPHTPERARLMHDLRSKLTDDQVREARRRRAAGEECSAIGRDMGVSPKCIRDTVNGRLHRVVV